MSKYDENTTLLWKKISFLVILHKFLRSKQYSAWVHVAQLQKENARKAPWKVAISLDWIHIQERDRHHIGRHLVLK